MPFGLYNIATMTRQGFVRILLSLLLLISQQMATAHVLSHLSGSLQQQQTAQLNQQDDGLSSALAQHQSCSECLAFAQLAGPLGNSPRVFAAPAASALSFQPVEARAAGACTILGFQSRAPPQA